jgi:prepilin-type N-terminal cleavage/methylation domain-containing protein
MDSAQRLPAARGTVRVSPRGFTLIELLTVIAIISLLISILVPSLSKARDGAKNTKTRAIMKTCGDGLEQFATENDSELRGQSYPSSKAADDPTDSADGTQSPNEDMFGAQWLVRYLMGKRLDGYVVRKSVPQPFLDQATTGWAQKGWYANPGDDDWPSGYTGDPPTRSGPYYDAAAAKIKAPKDLANPPQGVDPSNTTAKFNNPVFVDTFEMPILYYAADSTQSSKANANITSYAGVTGIPPDPATAGIYTFKDNALFTGLCIEGLCDSSYPQWQFTGLEHKLNYGPSQTWVTGSTFRTDVGSKANSFAYQIMNRQAYDSTGAGDLNKKSVVPNRRDGFLLWSPGKDGMFGTEDDVKNF